MKVLAIVTAALALVPIWVGDSRFLMGLVISGLLFACYGVAFNLIFGETNQLFLCVGSLAGVGGYLSALLSDRAGLPFPFAILVAGLGAALLGGTFSWVAARRSLDTIFTGIVTLAFSLSFGNLLLGQRTLTGGENGLAVEAGIGTLLRGQTSAYYAFLVLVVLSLFIHWLLQRSTNGWAFRSLRDDEQAAELAGVDVARYRIRAGLVGSAILGVTGAVFTHYEGFISPSTFSFLHVDVPVLVMVALGGIGDVFGPLLGAVIFTILDELLVGVGQLREVVYGLLLIALFTLFRRGVIPTFMAILTRQRA